jgi:predicted naringenin-chalcone synthase
MKPCISAIGTSNPAHHIPQEVIAEFMVRAHRLQGKERNRLIALYRATGISHRYSVLPDYGASPEDFRFFQDGFTPFPGTSARNAVYKKNALPLALEAVEDCIPNGFDKKSITHLITVSCTGLYAPGLDIELVGALGLVPNTRRTAINFMGCYAVFNAISLAKSICESSSDAKVLLVSVELCSLHFQKATTPDFMLSNALFGDGAAAALVENVTAASKLEVLGNHCTLVPEGNLDMSWQVGDTGFEMKLSENVPDLIQHHITSLVDNLLASYNLQLSDIDHFAIHPGGKRILVSAQQALGITSTENWASLKILRSYGNMSSATILFVLKEIWNKLNLHDHDKKVLCIAFGPGLTLECMILRST